MAANPEFRRWWAAYLRTAASPGAAVALTRMNSEADIRSILPAIRVPTLVAPPYRRPSVCGWKKAAIWRTVFPARASSNCPESITCLSSETRMSILDEVEEFLTGVRHSPRAEPVLATVLSASFQLSQDVNQPAPRVWQRLRDHIDRELEWSRGRDCSPRASQPAGLLRWPRSRHPLRLRDCPSCLQPGNSHARRPAHRRVRNLRGGIRGAAVEAACQIAQYAGAAEILVSTTVRDLVAGSGIRFQHKGTLECGGVLANLQFLTVDSGIITNPLPNPYNAIAAPYASYCMETIMLDTTNNKSRRGEYALASGAAAVRRLFVLHNIYGPAGRRILLQAGLKPGMHVADFGCGVGAVTHMLGEIVGPSGSVTGIDASAGADRAGRRNLYQRRLDQRRVSNRRRLPYPLAWPVPSIWCTAGSCFFICRTRQPACARCAGF